MQLGKAAGSRYQFGPFEANLETGELRRRGLPVKLQEQPFRLLGILLENAGEIVSREHIQARIWPDGTFVDYDSGLRVALRKLREALGDEADNPRYVETIPRRGYRFVYPVIRPEAESAARAEPVATAEPAAPTQTMAIPAISAPLPTARRRMSSTAAYGLAALAILVLLAAGLFFWQRQVHAHTLTDKDILVLADFANATGDPVFDDTLRQALAIQLEQSPFLKIMDDEQVNRTLSLMGLPRGTRISNQIAHDVCVRNGSAATINGSIATVGKSYVLTLQAAACQGGATIAREQDQADGKENVLKALQAAATNMRARLGESRASIDSRNKPLEQVTSGSLEALQSYSSGIAILGQGNFGAAQPLFERAISLDPNFAMAYFYVGVACGNAGDQACQQDYERKAYALIDRVSDYERISIGSGYFEATGEADKALDIYRLGTSTYPRYWGFHNYVSATLMSFGQFEGALQEAKIANQLQPDAEPPYRRFLDAYINLDRNDDARKIAEELRSRNFGGARIHQRLLELAYSEGDEAAGANEIEWFAGKPEAYLSYGLQAAYRNMRGRRRESSSLYRQASQAAARQGIQDMASEFADANALAAALSGQCADASHLQRPALALALCGNLAGAEKLNDAASKRNPKDLIWNTVQLPAIRAAMALHQKHPDQAIELLESARPYERSYAQVPYLRGEALLQLKKGAEAATEFRKITEHKGASWGTTWEHPNWGLYDAVSRLGLARALALGGDQARARNAYEDLFALWKNADDDIPLLRQARAEFAKSMSLSAARP